MYLPDEYPDVPQSVLIETLETDFAATIQEGPEGDCHFDLPDTTHIEWGWDFGQAWVPAMAIHYLCFRLNLEIEDVYAAMLKRLPAKDET